MAGAPVPVRFNPQGFLNFSPYGTIALGVNGNGTAASASFTTNLSINANSIKVQNDTTQTVFVAFGSSSAGTVTATVPTATESNNSTPVPGNGGTLIFTKLGLSIPNASNTGCFDTVSVLPGSTAGNVFFTAGDGS